ncbi:unnamed protein product, partial [Laminaria digitata]
MPRRINPPHPCSRLLFIYFFLVAFCFMKGLDIPEVTSGKNTAGVPVDLTSAWRDFMSRLESRGERRRRREGMEVDVKAVKGVNLPEFCFPEGQIRRRRRPDSSGAINGLSNGSAGGGGH